MNNEVHHTEDSKIIHEVLHTEESGCRVLDQMISDVPAPSMFPEQANLQLSQQVEIMI
jgi:hypothetical protein